MKLTVRVSEVLKCSIQVLDWGGTKLIGEITGYYAISIF